MLSHSPLASGEPVCAYITMRIAYVVYPKPEIVQRNLLFRLKCSSGAKVRCAWGIEHCSLFAVFPSHCSNACAWNGCTADTLTHTHSHIVCVCVCIFIRITHVFGVCTKCNEKLKVANPTAKKRSESARERKKYQQVDGIVWTSSDGKLHKTMCRMKAHTNTRMHTDSHRLHCWRRKKQQQQQQRRQRNERICVWEMMVVGCIGLLCSVHTHSPFKFRLRFTSNLSLSLSFSSHSPHLTTL